MSWELVVGFNMVIALCYVAISVLILTGLARTKQVRANKLAIATALIFASCAVHHWAHALHLLIPEGGGGRAGLEATRQTYSGVHNVVIEVVGAVVAVTYLGLRRNYKTLLNTPVMFDDAVRAAAEEQLRVMAFTDQLTGVPNRAAYQAFADRRADEPGDMAVLFVDLDGFKSINDRYGHDTGDRLLRDVAQRISAGLGPGERLYRIGGDEFIVVAQGPLDAAAITSLTERVSALISEPVPARDGSVSIVASIGVATGEGRNLDQLVREADVLMFGVKSSRRSGVQVPES